MSLHADLSPEALARLHAQRRNSTISSIVIAFLSVVLVSLLLGIFLLPSLVKESPTIVTYEANLTEEVTPDDVKVATNITRPLTPPSQSIAKVIVANTASTTSVQVPNVDVSTPSMDFGAVEEYGTNWGEVVEDGFGNVPASMKKRCSLEDRLARLQETGGTPECEKAVTKALDWFKATQSADGSWTGKNKPAMTALALLAYLGRCETPLSKDYGDSVLRAITYLVNYGMKNNGILATNFTNGNAGIYEHAMATYALAEASTFCKQGNINVPNLFEITQKAGQIILDNQHKSGSWTYRFDKEGKPDSSVTAWILQALKACEYTGLEFKGMSRATRSGVDFMESFVNAKGGVGYWSANVASHGLPYFTMSGGGLLCMQMFGGGNSGPARRVSEYIEGNSKFKFNTIHSDLYGQYYEVQAMLNRGGKAWERHNAMFRDELLNNQNDNGSWKAPNNGNKKGIIAASPEFVENEHYRTALCTLMLEVYFRFLPGTGAGAK